MTQTTNEKLLSYKQILFGGKDQVLVFLSVFHLSALEAIYIKTLKPDLCRQKEFVYSLKVFH